MRLRFRGFSTRMRRRLSLLRRTPRAVPLMILLFILIILVSGSYQLFFRENNFDHSLARTLLRWGMPYSSEYEGLDAGRLELRSFIFLFTNYDLGDPLTILEKTLPFNLRPTTHARIWEERPFVFIKELSFGPDPIRPERPGKGLRAEQTSKIDSVQVLIYHTHTSEMYLGRTVPASRSQEAHYQFRNLADPTITGVMSVGRHLANALSRLGITVLHETRVHTLPNINHSYGNSEKTVREILAQEKNLQMVLDLHRDAAVPNPTTIINGLKVARLALVIGTAEKIPLAHPNFRSNLDFAHSVKNVCDEMYPGLMRPIQIQKDARYNQHLHPRSIIVELGSVENTLEEALLSAELLANVFARVL
ncbi:MAG: stage II sporulation protein P [Firmicutes bacterium]|nr:stage II sporulation protein P [Bacillota bacterium]